MTPAEFGAYQRDMVRLSLLREDSKADRRDMPRKPRAVIVTVAQVDTPISRAHVYVIPVVTENEPLL